MGKADLTISARRSKSMRIWVRHAPNKSASLRVRVKAAPRGVRNLGRTRETVLVRASLVGSLTTTSLYTDIGILDQTDRAFARRLPCKQLRCDAQAYTAQANHCVGKLHIPMT
jgi:hypothetical protein